MKTLHPQRGREIICKFKFSKKARHVCVQTKQMKDIKSDRKKNVTGVIIKILTSKNKLDFRYRSIVPQESPF